MFYEKTGKDAYSHPRFGYKMFKKSGKSLEELLDENPIYRWNYERNRKLCLPDSVPEEYKPEVINQYKKEPKKDVSKLLEFFNRYNLFELQGKLQLL
jgi:hypothetical protein